jgi:uncharacterized protein (UPF0333 family)
MKRGQLKLSFGMIFSIILIIIFLGFAFYSIIKIVDFQKKTQVGLFIENFQTDIDNMWQSSKGSQQKDYSLPSNIIEVCFEEGNIITFNPLSASQNFNGHEIKHVTIAGNFCVENLNGKINIKISKDFDEELVNIEGA